ncbi:MAG TPA: hypothetical protein VMP67_05440 [Candidatus Limnocylindria bacterium]|nr:hypothetical protein [Candidatus Limnocylindria bacterium]
MSRTPSQPDFDLLLVDGNNLLHRTHGAVTPGTQAALLAQLRGSLPGVRMIVVFDGRRPASGPPGRFAGGPEVRYASGGPGAADEALVALIGEVPWDRRGWTVLVTDDRALTERARSAGALTRRLDWLAEKLGKSRR